MNKPSWRTNSAALWLYCKDGFLISSIVFFYKNAKNECLVLLILLIWEERLASCIKQEKAYTLHLIAVETFMLEAAAFLLPTINSRFFDGPAFISPLPPLIKAHPLTLYHEKRTKRACWQKRRIKSQFLIPALSVSETRRYPFSKRPKLINSAGWWSKETVSLSRGKTSKADLYVCVLPSLHGK